MWYFLCPKVAFGEDALSYINQIQGKRAYIVTDANIVRLGFLEKVQGQLALAGFESSAFTEVEPEPCLETVQRCAESLRAYQPDWVVGLGGGSCMDAAKAAWILYERPDVDLESIAPFEQYGLRAKARLLTIPTTAGSGSEASNAAVIKCNRDRRKIEVGSLELIADVTIVDPQFSLHMPLTLTIDVGFDVLSHAIEVYHTIFANDFTDALCLHAARLVFTYLPRAVEHGADDPVARERMANAATIAGICVANSNIALAHALGHSAGGIFDLTHGRVTAVFLPQAIEFTNQVGAGRYLEMARVLGLPAQDERSAGESLAEAVRALMRRIGLPLSLHELGITKEAFDSELVALVERAEMDLGLVTSRRIPEREEIRRLFQYAFDGRQIDF